VVNTCGGQAAIQIPQDNAGKINDNILLHTDLDFIAINLII
jgi:hypothetical protein